MRNTEQYDDSIYIEKAPGTGGIFTRIFFAVFGTILVLWSLCYATNFICDFCGIDFNAFVWVKEFAEGFPDLLESWIELGKSLLETAKVFLE